MQGGRAPLLSPASFTMFHPVLPGPYYNTPLCIRLGKIRVMGLVLNSVYNPLLLLGLFLLISSFKRNDPLFTLYMFAFDYIRGGKVLPHALGCPWRTVYHYLLLNIERKRLNRFTIKDILSFFNTLKHFFFI